MTKRILVFLLVVGMSLCFIPTAKAYGYAYGEKTNTVDVYVGYFGSTYVYIGTVTEDEMQNNCYCDEWRYSSIDNGLFTRYNLAYGVTMESLLSYLNITTSDIDEVYFLGTDNNYYAGFHDLFGVTHYYFPYLAENYDQADPDASNVGLINSSRIEVPAILAFRQSLYRDTGAFDEDKYRSMMDDNECLRIVFGQTVWNEVSTSDSVKWVYEIAVMLKGCPITAENMELNYGSSDALQYDVNSGYAELDEMIRNGLKIWSDNDSIVSVNDDGTLTGHQEGYANIHIQYWDGENVLETSAKVTVGPEQNDSEDPWDPRDPGNSGKERDPGMPEEEDTGDTENSGNTDQQDSDQKDSDQKDSDQKDQDQKNRDQKNQDQNDQNDNNTTYSTDPGSDGGAGSGGNNTGAGGNGADGYGSGTGNADTGSGSGGGLLSESQGGTEGDDIGGGNPFLEGTGDSTVESMGENAEASVQTVDDEASENPASAKTVYLSLGNVAGGETAGGSVSGSGTTGGSGGKMLEIEELPIYYYVILIVALAALFVGGGMYRSLRFRKDIAR